MKRMTIPDSRGVLARSEEYVDYSASSKTWYTQAVEKNKQNQKLEGHTKYLSLAKLNDFTLVSDDKSSRSHQTHNRQQWNKTLAAFVGKMIHLKNNKAPKF
jgi:hypothetical protein